MQHQQPLVSLALQTYNGTKYQALSLESCLRQTYESFEFTIDDDVSTDDSPRMAQEYASIDSWIRYLPNQVNMRLPASLNKGFASSRDEYLTWTCHDNLFEPTAIADMVQQVDQHAEVVMVYRGYEIFDDAGDVVGMRMSRSYSTLPGHIRSL